MDPTNNPVTPNPASSSNPTPQPNPDMNAGQVPTLDPSLVAPDSAAEAGGVAIGGAAGANVASQTLQPDSTRVAATDPIMMPEPAPEPDPIEEELKAPMKAAGPVPGSIGSAVSMPAGEGGAGLEATSEPNGSNPFAANDAVNPAANAGSAMGTGPVLNSQQAQTPNVAFNDPAMQPNTNNPMAGQMPVRKKANKTTLIALVVVAAIIVVVLAVFLIMMVTSDNSSNNNNNPSPQTNYQDDEGETENGQPMSGVQTLSCTLGTQNETVNSDGEVENTTVNESVSENTTSTNNGTTTMVAEFENNILTNLSIQTTTFDAAGVENTTSDKYMADEYAEALEGGNGIISAKVFETDANGDLIMTLDAMQGAYEAIDYVCEVL